MMDEILGAAAVPRLHEEQGGWLMPAGHRDHLALQQVCGFLGNLPV